MSIGHLVASCSRAALVVGSIVWLSAASSASAQEVPLPPIEPIATPPVEEGVELDVRRRHRPEFDPIGFPVGTWRLYPAIGARVGYESNLFGDENDRASAAYASLEPSLSLQYQPSWGEVRIDADGQFTRYLSNSQANEDTYQIAPKVRRDFGGGTVAEIGGEFGQLIERRDSSGFPDGRVAPVRYVETQVYAHVSHEGGRLKTLATVDYTNFNFRDTKVLSPDGDVIGLLDQDIRDQHIFRGSLRGEYEVSPTIGVFVQGIAQDTKYRHDQVSNGIVNLGGPSYTVLGGVSFEPGQLLRGSIGVGYVWRQYKGSATPNINGLAINADLAYFVTPLVTLSASASRTVEEAVLQDASGYVSNAASIRADYEFKRWLILHASAAYRVNDFRDNPRRDKIFELSAGADYSVDRHITFGIDAGYVDRRVDNDPFAASYDDFSVSARIKYNF